MDLNSSSDGLTSTTEKEGLHGLLHHEDTDGEHKQLVETISYCMLVIMVLGIFGNLFSLTVWSRRKLRKSRIAKYMCLLAVADIFTLVSGFLCRVLPSIWGIDLRKVSPFWCKSLYFILGFFACSSAWTLIVVTLERFVVIISPLNSTKCLAKCKAPSLVILVVILSGSVNCILIVITSWSEEDQCMIEESWADIAKLMIFVLYSPLPVTLLLILNTAIIIKMNRYKRQIVRQAGSMNSGNKKYDRKLSQFSTSQNSARSSHRSQVQGYHNHAFRQEVLEESSFTKLPSIVVEACDDESGSELPPQDVAHTPDHTNTPSAAAADVNDNYKTAGTSSRRPSSQIVELRRISLKDDDPTNGSWIKTQTITNPNSMQLSSEVRRKLFLEKSRHSMAVILGQIKTKSDELAEKYFKLKQHKSTIMLLAVTFSYFLLTTPYTLCTFSLIGQTLSLGHLEESVAETYYIAQHSLELLLCINHSINILLYCAAGSKFRREIKSMFTIRSHHSLYITKSTESMS